MGVWSLSERLRCLAGFGQMEEIDQSVESRRCDNRLEICSWSKVVVCELCALIRSNKDCWIEVLTQVLVYSCHRLVDFRTFSCAIIQLFSLVVKVPSNEAWWYHFRNRSISYLIWNARFDISVQQKGKVKRLVLKPPHPTNWSIRRWRHKRKYHESIDF